MPRRPASAVVGGAIGHHHNGPRKRTCGSRGNLALPALRDYATGASAVPAVSALRVLRRRVSRRFALPVNVTGGNTVARLSGDTGVRSIVCENPVDPRSLADHKQCVAETSFGRDRASVDTNKLAGDARGHGPGSMLLSRMRNALGPCRADGRLSTTFVVSSDSSV
jgi:hypothetical protein